MLERVNAQEMREGKSVHTVRDSCYHKAKGAEKTWGGGGGGGQQTRQRYDKLPTSYIYTTWARILSDRNVFCTLRGRGKRRGLMPLGLFLLNYENQIFSCMENLTI